MAKDCDRLSARLSGGTYGTTIAVPLQRKPQATGRGMLIGSLNAKDPLPHERSLHGLDWLNFSLAALLMGFGPFVAIKLADRGWVPANIGLVLTASGVAALLTQVPAGELIDMSRSKRLLVGMATTAIISAVLVFGPRPDFPSVFAGALIQGTAGSVLGPGVAAISLGVVGQEALAERLGRNQRFASIGGLTAAGIMGVIGYLVSTADIFLVTAAFGIPVILALVRIRADDIHFGRSCCAPDPYSTHPQRVSRAVLFEDHRLLTFATCLFLFQVANASILPLIGETLVHAEGRWSSPVTSALIVAPQVIVALLAPWVGRTANTWGRRPLLLIGLGVVPIRAAFFALTVDPALLVVVQMLDGLSGATLGVLTTLVIADLAKGTGRFNLAQGLVGTLSAIGASLSTSMSGLVVEKFGYTAGFLSVTTVGLIGVGILWMCMPETKPSAVQLQIPAPRTSASER
jgi:MFS family permease